MITSKLAWLGRTVLNRPVCGVIPFLAALPLLAQTPEIITDHSVYLVGEPIVASFQGGPANPKDWVGIYPDGTVPGSVGSTLWLYTDNTQNGTTGFTEGSVTFANGLATAGDWDVHLLLNDGYTVLASTKIKVIEPYEPYVRLNKRVYAPGETISVAFTNGPANPKDWIGIYPADRQPGNGNSLLWAYVDGTQSGTTGHTEGVISFSQGLPAAGNYVAYLLLDDGYSPLASEAFTVAQPAPAGPRVLSIRPAAHATDVPPDLEFLATITNGLTQVATETIVLSIDNAAVPATIGQDAGLVTVGYTNTTLLAPKSTHSYQLVFADNATPPTRTTNQADFTVIDYRNLILPAPLYFENFDATTEGQLPPGWSSVSYSEVVDENSDLQDLNSKAYANWLVVSRDRFTQPFLSYTAHEPTTDYTRVLSSNPANVVNNRIVRDLISGRFVFGDSGYRDGASQYLILYTPDYDLRGRTNVHLAFHSIWEQNQDSLGAVEYSVDRGNTWLPVVYLLDGSDVVRDAEGNIDAIATFTNEHTDVAFYTDPVTGETQGGTYGAFIGAAISAELAAFISPRVNDDPVESKRIEFFPLPNADNQAAVRFRFAHAGTDSWYFGIDDFGLYSISTAEPAEVSLTATRSGNNLVLSWPADAVGFVLESSDSLNQPQWKAVSGVTGNSANLPMTSVHQFYRLRK
jgi:hypothetical protein